MLAYLEAALEALRAILKAVFLFLRRYDYVILGVIAAFLPVYYIQQIMRRLDERNRRGVGDLATFAGFLIVTMLLSFGYAEPWRNLDYARHIPYVAALCVLVFAGGAWLFRALLDQRRPGTQPVASRPPFVLLGVCIVTILILWAVEYAASNSALPTPAGISGFLGTATAAGALAMATIQGIRSLLPLRGAFHRVCLERWIAAARAETKLTVSTEASSPTSESAR